MKFVRNYILKHYHGIILITPIRGTKKFRVLKAKPIAENSREFTSLRNGFPYQVTV